jgi:hypothetical protein
MFFLNFARFFKASFLFFFMALASLLVVYWLDLSVYQEFSLFPLYLLPILISLFWLGRYPAYIFCFLSSLFWLIAALQSNFYSSTVAPYIGMFSRLFFFTTTTYLILLYQQTTRRCQDQLNQLRRILPICPNCGRMLCIDGQWRTFDDILKNISIHDLSPSCHCRH